MAETNRLSNEDLMEAYQNGDMQAFDELYPALRKLIHSVLKSRKIADRYWDDIEQLVWVGFTQSVRNYDRTKSKVSTWICTITNRRAVSYFRSLHSYNRLMEKAKNNCRRGKPTNNQEPAGMPCRKGVKSEQSIRFFANARRQHVAMRLPCEQ